MPPIRRPEERIGRTLARLAPGTLGGTLPSAARPVTPVGELRTAPGGGSTGGPGLHLVGPVVVTTLDPWVFTTFGVWTTWLFDLTVPSPATATTVRLLFGGSAVGADVALAAGVSQVVATRSVTADVGDRLFVQIVAAGVGAQGLKVFGAL
jgi:hypothetical protein